RCGGHSWRRRRRGGVCRRALGGRRCQGCGAAHAVTAKLLAVALLKTPPAMTLVLTTKFISGG
ncbi:hypothetical protein, partial [Actinoplanes sp. NPDC026623]|uniref:hypothetical protein n=1 Tax=Actinoplanes sp. NPDC026623 TaxID=3155610 RepID=UPI0033E3B37A